jgi:uncharacterized protein (DUF58 family)
MTSLPPDTSRARGADASPSQAEHLLRRLEWTAIRRLDGLLQGDYRTLLRGNGMDLADLREYQHHDDVRHIDWNVTARHGTPHVRVFTEDREMAAWFLVDLSPSIASGTWRPTSPQSWHACSRAMATGSVRWSTAKAWTP